MPKRKRTGGDAADGDASDVVDDTVSGYTVTWQWEGDGGVWMSYAGTDNHTLSEAYNKGKKEVTLTIGGGNSAKVLFEKSVQKNMKTGWERRVRCALKAASDADVHVWEWENEHSKWNPYNTATSILLEDAHQGKTSGPVSVEAFRRAYSIDVSKMEQTNDSTGVIRHVRRDKIELAKVKEEVPVPTKVSKRGAPRAASAATVGGDASDVDDTGKGSSRRKGKSGKSASGEGAGDTKVKTLLLKGKAPVDPECTAKLGKAHAHCEGKDVYDAMLNQTNIGNNNNKFYLIQLLKDDNKNLYNVWLRWGRVGKTGQTNLVSCGPDLDEAKKIFCGKYYDKTRNEWACRSKFVKVAGKYDMVQIDYNLDEKATPEDPAKPIKVPDSKLDKKLQDLINLICDVKNMEAAVKEMKFDAQRAPLGKLTESQIKAGYSALKVIDNCIQTGDLGQKLMDACSMFYTRIPHDFGMQRPPTIRTKAEVKAKLQLLEALADIEVAMKIISEVNTCENPVDTHYKSLGCILSPLEKTTGDFKMLEDYVKNTHAATHNQYSMEVLNAYTVDKAGEKSSFVDHGNRYLLWHGSRLTNWVGILSQRLRIAPPEAPVTGYMFGKGIYFADMSSKSANYCFATKSSNVGLVLLCEVSLGKTNDLLAADYAAQKLPKGCHSVKGLGKIAPNPKGNFTMTDGTVVPMGKSHDTGVTNPNGFTLNYNEFIVYNINQVRMRYLLKVKFNFK